MAVQVVMEAFEYREVGNDVYLKAAETTFEKGLENAMMVDFIRRPSFPCGAGQLSASRTEKSKPNFLITNLTGEQAETFVVTSSPKYLKEFPKSWRSRIFSKEWLHFILSLSVRRKNFPPAYQKTNPTSGSQLEMVLSIF